jgi:acetyl esterase/lipase
MLAKCRLMIAFLISPCLIPTATAYGQGTVTVEKGICYGRKDEGNLHQLDMYLPASKNFPVVVFAHGGAWLSGDKSEYDNVGRFFAENGIGAVLVNYRLSPKVRHPAHVQDVAKSVAWARRNIRKHGGNPDSLYLCGYSAGGHLVSLLATDESYLKAEGVPPESIRGVISISGVYSDVKLPGLHLIFPSNDRDKSFPLYHANKAHARFRMFYAEGEIFGLDLQAKQFHRELLNAKRDATLTEVRGNYNKSTVDHFNMVSDQVLRELYGHQLVDLIHGNAYVIGRVK